MISRLPLLGAVAAALAWAGAAQAQGQEATATAHAAVQVIRPVQASAITPLSFGWVQSGARSGSITVPPTGRVHSTGVSTASLLSAFPATFLVRGEPNWGYDVVLPQRLTIRPILSWRHGRALTVADFRSASQVGGARGRLDGTGRDVLRVGATIQVPANTPGGLYAVMVPVTVSYD